MTDAWKLLCRPEKARLLIAPLLIALTAPAAEFARLPYNNPGLEVDLGVGFWAWVLPMDFNGDGSLDLVVACPDKPYNGIYFFENPAAAAPNGANLPVFKAGVRISNSPHNVQVSFVAGEPHVLTPATTYPHFKSSGVAKPIKLSNGVAGRSGRRKLCIVDWDGDGRLDLLLNSQNAQFWRQVRSQDGNYYFKNMGNLHNKNIEGHDVSPTVVDFNNDGIPEFVGGAEDGHLYYLKRQQN